MEILNQEVGGTRDSKRRTLSTDVSQVSSVAEVHESGTSGSCPAVA